MPKRATIKDVARLAEVSVTTVSLILNHKGDRFSKETINRVRTAQASLGYVPDYFAQGMTTKATKTLGVLVPDITNPFFSQFSQGVEEVASRAGFIPLIYNVGTQDTRSTNYLQELVRRTVDGFIIAAPNVGLDIIHQYLDQNKVPYLLMDQSASDSGDRIIAGDFEGGQKATQYLLDHHHRKVAVILPRQHSNNIDKRLKGYQKAMINAGITVDSDWLIEHELTKKGGYEAAAEVIESGVSAVFAINDEMAIGLYRGLQERGKRVPEDISIIGYDNIEWCQYVQPQLTTIEQPIIELGRVATGLLLDRLKTPDAKPQTIKMATKLIARASVIDYQEVEQ